jgi:hypothetical protein
MKSARERMDMIAAYTDVGSFRGAAAICGCDPKTVKLAMLKAQGMTPEGAERAHNYDVVADVVVMAYGSCKSRSAWTTMVASRSDQGGPGHEKGTAVGAGA